MDLWHLLCYELSKRRGNIGDIYAGTEGYLERVKGIEPSYAAWEAAVLPLNYTR